MKKISDIAKKVDVVVWFLKKLLIVTLVIVVVALAILLGEDATYYLKMKLPITLSFVSFRFLEECSPDSQTMKFYFWGMLIVSIVVIGFIYYELVIIQRIIKPMIEQCPFDSSVVKNIRLLSWVILIGEGILSIVDLALQIFRYYAFDFEKLFLSDKLIGVSADFDLDISFIWTFLIVYLLSYVFQYGQELQIQSDETL
ncbi:MAG: hypothetical protein IJO60_00595 [Agathobacter sp.]|nr:hypothetical protein [Agathobacter sp.]